MSLIPKTIAAFIINILSPIKVPGKVKEEGEGGIIFFEKCSPENAKNVNQETQVCNIMVCIKPHSWQKNR